MSEENPLTKAKYVLVPLEDFLKAARGSLPALDADGICPAESPRLPSGKSHGAALKRLANAEYFNGSRYLEQQLRADWTDAPPELKAWAGAFVNELRLLNVPFFVTECRRSAARQAEMKAKGRSQLLNGPHMHSLAVDVIHSVKGWELTPQEWGVVGLIGKDVARRRNLKLTWGGEWKFYDPAHWELTDWSERANVDL